MYWRIQRQNAKTGTWTNTIANAGITDIDAIDVGKPSARVWVKGHKLRADGTIVYHRIQLSADVVRRMAEKLQLDGEG